MSACRSAKASRTHYLLEKMLLSATSARENCARKVRSQLDPNLDHAHHLTFGAKTSP
jgi:hypothetical protein